MEAGGFEINTSHQNGFSGEVMSAKVGVLYLVVTGMNTKTTQQQCNGNYGFHIANNST